MPVVAGEVLHRDVHPAEVALPDGGVLTDCRVFVTSHRIVVFHHNRGAGRVEVALDESLTELGSVPANRGSLGQGRLECRVDAGTIWVNTGSGCGCGSPLKALSAPVSWAGIPAVVGSV